MKQSWEDPNGISTTNGDWLWTTLLDIYGESPFIGDDIPHIPNIYICIHIYIYIHVYPLEIYPTLI